MTTDYRLQTTTKKGFTLIEMLVVVAIFGGVFLIISQILFSTFRGASKSEVTASAKREGEKVLGTMERSLHNARSVSLCPNSSSVVYSDQDGSTQNFVCSNGAVTRGQGQTGVSGQITSVGTTVTSCSIACSLDPVEGVIKVVTIQMTFRHSAVSSPRAEEVGTIDLTTRVLLRN